MRLVNFNIGIKIDNAEEAAKFILSQRPDIVAFQEIVRHLDESVFDMYKSKQKVESVIGKMLPNTFFGPQWIADAMRKNGKIHRDFNGHVEQGNEVLSRFPILSATNEHYYKQYALELEWANFHAEDHPRSVQVVELDVNGTRLQILNVHGTYSKDKKDSKRTLDQNRYILKAAKRKNIPTIIVGDFNLFPGTQSMAILSAEFRDLITEYGISSTRPAFQDDGTDRGSTVVDYIFVDKNIAVNGFGVVDVDISDHLPLVLDFDIAD